MTPEIKRNILGNDPFAPNLHHEMKNRNIEGHISNNQIFKEFTSVLDLSNTPSKENFIRAVTGVRDTPDASVAVISTVCPPYSTDDAGKPTYTGLDVGVSFNIRQHLKAVPAAMDVLKKHKVQAAHFFLMADTEVDLNPFLENQLQITPREFLSRCQVSVDMIGDETKRIYGKEPYDRLRVSPAGRFLTFFGEEKWYERYFKYKSLLLDEAKKNADGRVASQLHKDYLLRRGLVSRLLGDVSAEVGIAHIARQKAQYMAFGSLIRERFGEKVLIFNHTTPNTVSINDEMTRTQAGYSQKNISKSAIFELNISTLPGIL